MDEEGIRAYIRTTFPQSRTAIASAESGAPEVAWGDTFFFADREETNPHAFPFATIVTKDYGDFDDASKLNRPGIFRLNIGLSRESFRSLFGAENDPSGYDFTSLDKLMPHPLYAPQFFVCILNPSDATFTETVEPLLAEAYSHRAKESRT